MKKTIVINTLFLFSTFTVIAQSYDGNWFGQVQNANGTLKAEMNLKASANQISGQIFIISNGTKDVYNLKGNVSTNTATGTLVYKDGTVSKFSKIGSQ